MRNAGEQHPQARPALLRGCRPTEGGYRIDCSPEAADHLARLTRRQSATVLDKVERTLTQQPTVPARSRKILRANSVAPWELRVGELRVYYEVNEAPDARVVVVKAIGIKVRNRVLIGGTEVES
jgi:mRNA-degrading endonuclease RelE of RelBE toxin-antitoxin system